MSLLNAELRLPAWIIALAGLAVLALLFATHHYRELYGATAKALATLEGSVEMANKAAQDELERLTEERDREQARLNKLRADQEKKDAQAKDTIDRLASELANRPVRVRIVAASGQGGSCAPGQGAGSADDSAGDSAAATGLLPEENTRRLAAALIEVETLSAAYNSCRASLIPPDD